MNRAVNLHQQPCVAVVARQHQPRVPCPQRCSSAVSRSRFKCCATSASELHALVRQLAQCEGRNALLQDGELLHAVKALAAGEAFDGEQYAGDPQGMSALAQLLQPHASPEQQAALEAAAAAAAARPPQLSARQEAMQLLQEPLVSTALSRMRRDPGLALSSYGSHPAVSRAMGLLQDVLSEDQHMRQVVESMRSAAATAAAQASRDMQQHQHKPLHHHQYRQQQPEEHPVAAWPVPDNSNHQQQHQQRQRSPARTAVIARSASTHSAGSAGESAAGRGPATNP